MAKKKDEKKKDEKKIDEKKKDEKKKGSTMNPTVIKSAIDMVKSLSELSGKVIEAGDPEKYAQGVEKLHSGVSESYAMMRTMIENDSSLTTDEKLEKLKKIAEDEAAAKQRCGEALEGNREKVAKISMDVLKGFLTCGLYFTPAIIKSMKNALSGKDDAALIEIANATSEADETSETDHFSVQASEEE